jgi:putative thioredoxin
MTPAIDRKEREGMDATVGTFEAAVIERSRELPVVVDFWAPWCGPCHRLAPVLETEVAQRDGSVTLVKVNVDENPELAHRYAVAGIPSVMAFRDGAVVDQFVGAVPPSVVRTFLDGLGGGQAAA